MGGMGAPSGASTNLRPPRRRTARRDRVVAHLFYIAAGLLEVACKAAETVEALLELGEIFRRAGGAECTGAVEGGLCVPANLRLRPIPI
jgi:hypothetical protein